MNHAARILTLPALAAIAVGARATDDDGVRVIARNGDGGLVGSVPVNLDSKIRFASDGVEFFEGDTRKSAFKYGHFATLAFLTPGTGVNTVTAESPLRLLSNPVGERLEISGLDSDCASLVITSLNGELKLRVAEWRGEALDVTTLTPGLYFVTVGRTTLKFIKK